MKKIFAGILIVLIANCAQAQSWGPEMGLNYVYTAPLGSMKNNIRQGNGVAINIGMLTPSKRFSIGIEIQYTQYGYDESRQQYDLDDGTTANMEVTVSNSFMNFMAYGRCYLITEGSFLPYLSAKGGYSHYRTDLNIYDPDEWDHCSPVESDLLQRDGTMIGSVGAGFRLDFASMIKKATPGRFYLDFSSTVTQGGTVKYMNTDAPMHHPASHDALGVEAEFLNTQTQVVHKHHVGTLYSSPVQMLDFRLGVSLGRRGKFIFAENDTRHLS